MRGSVVSTHVAVAFAALPLLAPVSAASATDFNAGAVMEKMAPNERAPYIQGVIEGLAFSRYQRDNAHVEGATKTVAGMKCIYDWFYEKPHALDMIYVAFGKFPNYPPAAIINSLIKQDCPE